MRDFGSDSVRRGTVLGVLIALAVVGCSFDGPQPGVQSACTTPAGTPLGCDAPAIETPEQACDKLVDCGAIPVENEEEFAADYSRCVDTIHGLEGFRLEFVLACVEASSCDELVTAGETCFEHGDP